MSYTVSAATDTAVSASISTPVFAVVRTVAVISIAPRASSGSSETSMPVSGSGWQSGISSCVRFAAMMPAICAVVSTSPFAAPPETMSASVSALM